MTQKERYDQPRKHRLIMPTLFMITFGFQVPPAVLSFFLVDIASTFDTSVGVAGQLGTAGFIASIISAAMVGVLTSKFTYKSLLLASFGSLALSGLGASLAPTFSSLLVMYALSGITTGITMSLGFTLIARYFPVHERPKRSSYLSIGYVLPGIVTPLIFGVIADWRLSFLIVLGMTCGIVGLLWIGLPSEDSPSGRPLAGYLTVLQNKSALGIIIANIFATAGFIVLVVFSVSLFREKFSVSSEHISLIATGMWVAYMIGILVGGRIIHRVGRKVCTALFCFSIGFAIIGLTVIPILSIALICYYVATFSGGIRGLALMNFAVEQVPTLRAVMLSLTTVSQYGASTLGTTLGGLILIHFNYDWLAILGAFTVVAGVIFQLATVDPTKQEAS